MAFTKNKVADDNKSASDIDYLNRHPFNRMVEDDDDFVIPIEVDDDLVVPILKREVSHCVLVNGYLMFQY